MSPPPVNTAEAQLGRLLWLVPAAARPGGIALDQAARELEVSVDQVRRDVQALTERAYYHPGGTAEGLMIELTDRLEIRTTGQFGRPPRLTPRELFAVVLGLRLRGAEDGALVERLERQMAFGAAADEPLELPQLQDAWGADEILDAVREGWRARQCCAFGYLKPGADAPETRRLHCWGLLHAEGRWYATGIDPDVGEPRNFRLDRMVAAGPEGEPGAYEIPEDFDPASVLEGGARVFVPGSGARADDAPALVVRYAPEVGPWARERWDGQADHDGWYTVRHHLADPDWAIRHVLAYGPHAELVEPAELRDAVRAVATRMAGAG